MLVFSFYSAFIKFIYIFILFFCLFHPLESFALYTLLFIACTCRQTNRISFSPLNSIFHLMVWFCCCCCVFSLASFESIRIHLETTFRNQIGISWKWSHGQNLICSPDSVWTCSKSVCIFWFQRFAHLIWMTYLVMTNKKKEKRDEKRHTSLAKWIGGGVGRRRFCLLYDDHFTNRLAKVIWMHLVRLISYQI